MVSWLFLALALCTNLLYMKTKNPSNIMSTLQGIYVTSNLKRKARHHALTDESRSTPCTDAQHRGVFSMVLF